VLREAIVLAGGFGTRLRSVLQDVPKPLAPINGKPFLHYILRYLQAHGLSKIVLSVGYLGEQVEKAFGDTYLGMQIVYAYEDQPLGTGGGIRLALESCETQDVLVLNGDTFFDIDLTAFYQFHQTMQADFTLALRQVPDASRYGTIALEGHTIHSFREKSTTDKGSGIINGGIYILNRDKYMSKTTTGNAFSIEQDVFTPFMDELHICGFISNAYFIDIGIPEDYAKAMVEIK
jgi:D-glycero-alpha-D-manno-heptose 1-phosphate guanylyltransferase